MRLIKSSVELLPQKPGIQGILEQIELAARTCYKSENNIKYDEEGNSLTAKDFVDKIVNVYKHQSVAEHGTVYLLLTTPIQNLEEYEAIADFYNKNPFSVVYKVESGYGVGLAPNYKSNNQGRTCYYITTNYRVLLENNRLDDLQYLCNPTEYHQKRVTIRVKCPISVSREWNRHRSLSISEQSTRYCNYSKDKFGNELTFCIPYWTPDLKPTEDAFDIDYVESASHKSRKFLCNLFKAEVDYLEYTTDDGLKPQEVREILPLCTATEVVYTGFISDWNHFFSLRAPMRGAKNVHPEIAKLADAACQMIQCCLNNLS